MVNSMTGYGTSHSTASGVEMEVIVKSLNGRYLDTRFHLPKEYLSLEADLKGLVAKLVQRGTVDIFVNRRLSAATGRLSIRVDKAAVRKWQAAYGELAKLTGQKKTELSLASWGALPEVLALTNDSDVTPVEKKVLVKLFSEALKSCVVSRAREGKALAKCLAGHFTELLSLLIQMEQHISAANNELSRKFSERLERNGLSDRVDSQRLAQEVAIYLDRCDVSEEIQRLREHVRHCQNLISGKISEGKKLDFYSQELLREVNTIGSKSQVAQLTELVVNAKAVIEKIKEQVQNVE